jgi:hypothetical protein
MTESKKKIHTELKGLLSNRFDMIKSHLGIQNDAEVIRFLIQYFYRKNFQSEEIGKKDLRFIKGIDPEEDKKYIDKIMEQYDDAIKRLGEN